jgi:hypothetical protein
LPRASAPRWRYRASADFDQYVFASINRAEGKYDPENGAYARLVINGIESRIDADNVRRGLFNSAYWHHKKGILPVSMSATVYKNLDETYRVEYCCHNKDHGRAYVNKTYGPNPEDRPYSPFRFHKNYNA